MSLTVAVLMGLLIIPATLAALPGTLQTSPPAWTQTNTADKKVLDEQLIEAIRADHVEEARALLQTGANANGRDGLGQPLYEAVNRNALIIARLLIEAGAQMKRSGLPFGWPLKTAAQADHAEMVRLLLSLGADVNGGEGCSDLRVASICGVMGAWKDSQATTFRPRHYAHYVLNS